MSLVITPAQSQQAQILSDLAMRSKAHWGYSAAFMQACKTELTYTAQMITTKPTYVATIDQQLVGFYQLHALDADKTELEAFFIEPKYIGLGIGTLLFNHAQGHAKDIGFRQMLIQSDPHAAAFYLKMGCIKAGEKQSLSVPGRLLPLMVAHL